VKFPVFKETEGLFPAHKSPPPAPIPSHLNAKHTFLPYFPKIRFNIILPFTPMSSEWSLADRLPNQNFERISHLPIVRYMLRQPHPL
jgi:hypothetical protein